MNQSHEITKAVHDDLLPVLTEEFEDKITVLSAREASGADHRKLLIRSWL